MRKLHQSMLCLLMLFTLGVQAQTKEITGKITDASGAPIPSATIRIKGTRTGTSSEMDGTFKINASSNAILVISGVGYEPKEFKTTGLSTISAQLSIDSKSLSEVVVTGVGTATSKKRLGIAVQSVSADKLPPAPTASIDQALVGKIPGAQISSVSGNPGDPVNIVLRGINTVQNGTKPLIMVDGIQVSATDINSLDLSNVERVEVVQGAASASLYGAQGANGVIQIFTKKGRHGPAVINYSTSYSGNQYINQGKVHKAQLHPYLTDASNNIVDASGNILAYDQYGSISGISYTYGGATRYAILNTKNVSNKAYNANLKYYDHFKEVFQTGSTLNNAINISGASDKSDYAISVANNHTVSPVMKNGYVDRSNLTANLGTELFKGFKIRSITQLVYTRNTLHPGLGAAGGYLYGKGNQIGNVGNIYGFLNTSPFFSLKAKLADGTSPNYQTADFVSINATNPYYVQEYNSGLDNKIDIIQNFDADYKVNKFVELDAKYGINYRTENAKWTYFNQSQNINSNYYGAYTSYFAPDNTGEIDNWQYNTTFQNFLASAYIKTDFQKDFNSKLPIQTSTQISFDYRKNNYKEYDTYGLGLPLAPPINMASTSTQGVAPYNATTNTNGDYVEPFITYGFLVNQKIDFGDYAGVSGGFRSDWSSAFGGGSKPFTFPHVDGYILPLSLGSLKDSKASDILPYFKLRAGYGEAGIQPGPFDRYPVISQGNLGSSLSYSNPIISQNPNLQVEVSKEFEAGTDFSITTNKGGTWFSAINGQFTYWKRKSKNVIYTVPTPLSSGATGILNNAIDMSSKGFEFQVSIPVLQSKNFTWNFTTNFGHQVSMIDKIAGGVDIPTGTEDNTGSTFEILSAGHKIGQIYGYKTIRNVNQTYQDGTPYIAKADAGKYQVVNNTLVDTATKGIMFTNEKYSLGDPNPKFNVSFINEITYKDFLTFSFQFDWVYGSHLYNQTKEWLYRDGISGDFTKPVTINGQTGAYTAYWASAYYGLWGSAHGSGNDATKDYFYEDASFLRLRNVSLALDIAKVAKVKYFKKLQLVLTGRNILTVTKYTGFDPEINSSNANSSFVRGIDGNTIPNIKSYQVGLNVGF
ncbi:MAG TPA: SusC/RagA family TonB-linked outer membrane protein [Puia sp.]|nr:SusC/RagA family TonB-linked outer membrane protein [Puia sp.]